MSSDVLVCRDADGVDVDVEETEMNQETWKVSQVKALFVANLTIYDL